MRKALLLCIVSIFLCGRAGAQDGRGFLDRAVSLHGQGDVALAAALYERALFEGLDSDEANRALYGRAVCCVEMGRIDDAAEALGRIMMYAMPESERRDVLKAKIWCSIKKEDFGEAEALLQELYAAGADESGGAGTGNDIDVPMPRLKSANAAAVLSIVPGLGHLYAGRPGEGLLSLALNAPFMGLSVLSFIDHLWLSATIGAGIPLTWTWQGAQARAAALVEDYNNQLLADYYSEILNGLGVPEGFPSLGLN